MVSVVAGKLFFKVSVVGCLMVSVVARNVFSWFPSFFVFMVSGCYRTAALSPMETIKKETSGRFRDELSIYIYIYIYIYVPMIAVGDRLSPISRGIHARHARARFFSALLPGYCYYYY